MEGLISLLASSSSLGLHMYRVLYGVVSHTLYDIMSLYQNGRKFTLERGIIKWDGFLCVSLTSFKAISSVKQIIYKQPPFQCFDSTTRHTFNGLSTMEANKDPEPKVEFSENKSDRQKKKCSRKTKIAVISILTVALLGAVVSVNVYFALKKTNPTRLKEVNLEEGETLTYKVDQHIEMQGNNVQKGRFVFCLRLTNGFLFN